MEQIAPSSRPPFARRPLGYSLANALDWLFLAFILGLALSALLPARSAAQSGGAPFTVVETGRTYGTLQSAVDAIGDRRGTIEISPGTYRQCAVQRAGVVIYVAREYGTVTFDRTTCEGKAALVPKGLGAEIRGLTFSNMAVRDGNGAGIRFEKGVLNIAYSRSSTASRVS